MRCQCRDVAELAGYANAAEQLRQLDRGQVAEFLRRRTIEMTTNPAVRTEEVFVWPKRVRW